MVAGITQYVPIERLVGIIQYECTYRQVGRYYTVYRKVVWYYTVCIYTVEWLAGIIQYTVCTYRKVGRYYTV